MAGFIAEWMYDLDHEVDGIRRAVACRNPSLCSGNAVSSWLHNQNKLHAESKGAGIA